MANVPMKTSFSRRRSTAYHMVEASPEPWMRSHGRVGSPEGGAMPASTSWCWVAT